MSILSDLVDRVSALAVHIGNSLQLRGFKEGGTAGQVPTKVNGTDFNWTWQTPSVGGVTDHGALTGLADNDHPQYALTTTLGSAAYEEAVDFASAIHAGSHTDGTDDIQSATAAQKGLATAAQITKLDGIATGATANSSDAFLLSRANHTGTQAHTTITGLGTAATTNTGTGASNTILGNDARLTDARTPTAHNHSGTDITSGDIAVARIAAALTTPGPIGDTTPSSVKSTTVEANDTIYLYPTTGRGTISIADTAVTGVGTEFLTDFQVGDSIGLGGLNFRTIDAIASNTSMTIGGGLTYPSGTAYTNDNGIRFRVYTNGNIEADGTITALNLTGTNTGDQTSIVGITGTLAQFNTAVTDADLLPSASPTITGTISIGTGTWDGDSFTGAQDFAERPTCSEGGTPAADNLVTYADVLTQLDSLIGWNLIPFLSSTGNVYNIGTSNSLTIHPTHMQLSSGGAGGAAYAGYVFNTANAQTVVIYKGMESLIYLSKRLKVRLGVSMAQLDGDAVAWFWVACSGGGPNTSAPPTTTIGFGIRLHNDAGTIKVTPVVHDGTTYIYGTAANFAATVYNLDMFAGTLNVYNADNTLVCSVSGGLSVNTSVRGVQIHGQTTLNNGSGNNYFRLRVNRMEYKFLES